MPVFADVQNHKDSLVRKGLAVTIGIAPIATTPLTTILSTDGTLAALPAAFKQLGRPTEDGVSWGRETELSEIFGHGSSMPVRSEIRRSTRRMTVTVLETRKAVLEAYLGMTIAATATKIPVTTGNQHLTWDEPDLPIYPYVRLIALARDITDAGEMYMGQHFLRAKVTEVSELMWSDQDSAMAYQLTYTAFQDSVAGTPVRHFRAGVGYSSQQVTDEGFTPAA